MKLEVISKEVHKDTQLVKDDTSFFNTNTILTFAENIYVKFGADYTWKYNHTNNLGRKTLLCKGHLFVRLELEF